MSSNCSIKHQQNIDTSFTPLYISLQIIHVVLCFLSLFITIGYGKQQKTLYFAPSTKILMKFYSAATCIYCSAFIITELYHIFSRLISSGCDLLVPVRICIFPRIFLSWSAVFFQMFFIGAAIDIILGIIFASLRKTRTLPYCIGTIMCLLAMSTTFPSVPIDLKSTDYLVNCASMENKSRKSLEFIFIFFLFMDCLSACLFVVLKFILNNRKTNPRYLYDVNKKMENVELERAFNLMLPNIVINSVCYVYYASFSLYMFVTVDEYSDPMVFMKAYSVPFYVFLSQLYWTILLKKKNGKIGTITSAQGDAYFDNLNQQWKKGEKVEHLEARESKSEKRQKKRRPNQSVTTIDPEQ